MFSALRKLLLELVRKAAAPVRCVKCGAKFKPYENEELTRVGQILERFPCPKCGFRFDVDENAAWAQANPPGPHEQPTGTRIEKRTPTADTLLFYLPAAGRSGLLLFAIIWNLFIGPLFYFIIIRREAFQHVLGPRIIISMMMFAGVTMLYGALRECFASHLLFLGPEIVRLQRQFLLRRNHDLPTAAIDAVRRIESYSQVTGGGDTDRPEVKHTSYHLAICSGLKRLAFGTGLREDEQLWLAWEVRDYLRQHGATNLPEELRQPRRAAKPATDDA